MAAIVTDHERDLVFVMVKNRAASWREVGGALGMSGRRAQRIWQRIKAREGVTPATLLTQNLKQIKNNLPISIYVGTKDPLLPGSQALHSLLTDLKVDHTYQEFDGIDHNLIKLSAQTKVAPFTFAAEHFK